MAITKTTLPYCLNVVWNEYGQMKGAAFYEQDVIRDGDAILSVKTGDAQPVAILGQKGIDVAAVIGAVGRDAIALAEIKDAEAQALQARLDALSAEKTQAEQASESALQSMRETHEAQMAALQSQLNQAQQAAAAFQQRLDELTAPTDANGVPKTVTALQAKAALLAAGLLEPIQAFVEKADPLTQLAWREAATFDRHSKLVNELAAQFGLSDAEVDALFVQAAQVQV